MKHPPRASLLSVTSNRSSQEQPCTGSFEKAASPARSLDTRRAGRGRRCRLQAGLRGDNNKRLTGLSVDAVIVVELKHNIISASCSFASYALLVAQRRGPRHHSQRDAEASRASSCESWESEREYKREQLLTGGRSTESSGCIEHMSVLVQGFCVSSSRFVDCCQRGALRWAMRAGTSTSRTDKARLNEQRLTSRMVSTNTLVQMECA